jgi:hypothetical protein
MTVYIEKPAVNLREELASLRNQGGYQEQQFYFDGLVTNGTFDSDLSGWTLSASTPPTWNAAGTMQFNSDGSTFSDADQSFSTTVGATYILSVEMVNVSGSTAVYIGTSQGSSQLLPSSINSIGVQTFTFTATTATTWLRFRDGSSAGNQQIDNIFIVEVDANDDVVHRLPKGWKPKDVFEDGLLQREGAAHDYEVVYDGFDYFVKPAVAPSATTQTCVIGVKA